MKQMEKLTTRLLMLTLLITRCLTASAYDFEVNGIYYDYGYDLNTVCVTFLKLRDFGIRTELISVRRMYTEYRVVKHWPPDFIFHKDYCQIASCPSEGAMSKSKFTSGFTEKKQYAPSAIPLNTFMEK